jgi:hypothetical protein
MNMTKKARELYIRQNSRLGDRLYRVFRRASPKVDEGMAADIAVDLTDLWSTGVEHRRHLRKLLSLSLPRDLEKLEYLLCEIEVNWQGEGKIHTTSLARSIPRILKATSKARPTRRKNHRRGADANRRSRFS